VHEYSSAQLHSGFEGRVTWLS